jgi:MFS family permease
MESEDETEVLETETDPKSSIKGIKITLLDFLIMPFTWSVSWIFINIIVFSNLIWPGEAIHTSEIAFLTGMGVITEAFTTILFGFLADRYNRVKILALINIFYGISFAMFGFIITGEGMLTYFSFFVINIIRSVFIGGHGPVFNSFATDATEEKERSQLYGIAFAIQQFAMMVAMLISALIFQSFWRQFFWIIGFSLILTGIFINGKLEEPKRAAKKEELRSILRLDNVEYKYQLNKETIKSTLLSKTNIIALAEGTFSQLITAIPTFLMFAYFQSPPYSFTPFFLSLTMIIFGLPGALVGSIYFAKLSDKYGEKNIKNRVYIIVFSLIGTYLIFGGTFFIPIILDNPLASQNLLVFLTIPSNWLLIILVFWFTAFTGVFRINQAPLIQKINLPEAQGAISSANQFLELLSSGFGVVLAGLLLVIFNDNFQMTVVALMILASIGSLMWLLTLKYIDEDVARISEILRKRAIELENNN